MIRLTKSPIFFLLLPLLVLFSACNKDEQTTPNEELNNALDGEWVVESFIIAGDQQMGDEYTEVTMEFDAETPESGESEWSFSYDTSPDDEWELTYDIRLEGSMLTVHFTDSPTCIQFEVEIDEDEMELTADIYGERWEIEAERD